MAKVWECHQKAMRQARELGQYIREFLAQDVLSHLCSLGLPPPLTDQNRYVSFQVLGRGAIEESLVY